MIVSALDRISYYLGKCVDSECVVNLSHLPPEVFKCQPQSIVYCTVNSSSLCTFPDWWGHHNAGFKNTIDCLHTSFLDIGFFLFLYRTGKINSAYYSIPVISSARNIGDDYLVLLRYNNTRQWSINNRDMDTAWSDKINEPIWRGQPSGVPVDKKPSRSKLVSNYFDKYNIAYSAPPNMELAKKNKKVLFYDPLYIEHIKPVVNIATQLKYKYLISMEGNDISSGLHWMLNSNSVVLMPSPKQESWLMEGKLVPWEHYIPLTEDLDLEEKLEWCKSHDKECQKISRNANLYMSMFTNLEQEFYIFQTVLNYYTKNVKFIL